MTVWSSIAFSISTAFAGGMPVRYWAFCSTLAFLLSYCLPCR